MPWLHRPVALSVPRRAWGPVVKILAIWLIPLLALFALGWLVRGAYHTPGPLATALKVAGALVGGPAACWLLRKVPSRRDGPLARLLTNVALGAIAGYAIVSLSLDLLTRQTSTQVRTERVPYEVTGGWKNCPYGVAFDDDALQARLTLCGSGLGVPKQPAFGTLELTEKVGRYGIVLQDVTVAAHR
ncbi:hypothetical protein R75461_02481 [Paraburkholderia nemoris]|nr:hypothetical protein R75461_02481 [Paraburkholderia nemoris]CAE6850749.1 hypothetical protein R69619_07438 [Paraburkholderia nemoris]